MDDVSPDPVMEGVKALERATRLRYVDSDEAIAQAHAALHWFESAGTRRGRAAAHLLVGQIAWFANDLAEARDHLIEARDLFGSVPIAAGEAAAREALGQVYRDMGEFTQALREYEAVLTLVTRDNDQRGVASLERRIGSLERSRGHAKAALEHYAKAAALFTELEDETGLSGVLLSLGILYAAVGHDAVAITAYRHARQLADKVGDRLGYANAARFSADAHLRLRQDSEDSATAILHEFEARDLYRMALSGYQAVHDASGESHVHEALGELEAASGDPMRAREELAHAIDLFAKTYDPINLADAVKNLARAWTTDHQPVEALKVLAAGVAKVRQAARWAASRRRQRVAAERIAALEAEALALAVDVGEGALAGAVIEGGVSGLVGLLPVLLDGPTSSDPKTEQLRHQIRQLAERLGELPSEIDPAVPPAETVDAVDDTPGTTRTLPQPPGVAPDRATVITQLEALLGPRAREVVARRTIDYDVTIDAVRARRFVVQYAVPGGLAEGQPLYVVWSGPDHAPAVSKTVLSETVAARLDLLAGNRLLADPCPGEAAPEPDEVAQVRGLGWSANPGEAAAAGRVYRRTQDLWHHLNQTARQHPAVARVAQALFPDDFVTALAHATDQDLPPRLLIVPGPHLWNLPWPGLVVTSETPLVALARVSLTPSLTSLTARQRSSKVAMDAWIPLAGQDVVRGTPVERAMVRAVFGPTALAPDPGTFLARLGQARTAVASVHGDAAAGLAHGVYLSPSVNLQAADLLRLDLPETLIIGACWSSRINPTAEPFALPLIAHARGAAHIIGGVFPLDDASTYPTTRLLTQLYPTLLGTDPATALWLSQHEAMAAKAPTHTWAGVIHSTTDLTDGDL